MPNLVQELRERAETARRLPELPGWFNFVAAVAATLLVALVLLSFFRSDSPTSDAVTAVQQPDVPGQVAATATGDAESDPNLQHGFDPTSFSLYEFSLPAEADEDSVVLTDREIAALFNAAAAPYNGRASRIATVDGVTPPVVPGTWDPVVTDFSITDATYDGDALQAFEATVFVAPDGSDDLNGATPIDVRMVWDDADRLWLASW